MGGRNLREKQRSMRTRKARNCAFQVLIWQMGVSIRKARNSAFQVLIWQTGVSNHCCHSVQNLCSLHACAHALPVVSSFFFFFSCLFVLFSESEIKNWIQELFLNAEGILSHGTELGMSCSHNFILLYGVLCPDGHIESSVFPKLLTVVPQ